jgi:hypothetical protein
VEESQKTLQLKSEIDTLVDQKGMTSSEESSSVDASSYDLSPNTLEKLKVEHRYKKKINRAMETFLDRVENQSSSGSNSGDERYGKCSKKRKFKEYLTGLKNNQSAYRVPMYAAKKRQLNEQK